MNNLLKIAQSVDLPGWATHVAVRNNGSKAEPAVLIGGMFVDEAAENGEWAAVFKKGYWQFFAIDQLSLL